jgi:hypothetical protein
MRAPADFPRAVRLGYWRYTRDLALMFAPLWVGLAVLKLREPTWLATVELWAQAALALGVILCAMSFCTWVGSRCAWRYGGRLGRWAATRHAYGARGSRH